MIIKLPIPPSINASTRNVPGRGRVKTKAYKDWLIQADKWFLLQKRGLGQMRGKCQIEIMVPSLRGDPSNRIKLIEDFLVSREITGDDRNNHRVSIEVDEALDCCEITISEFKPKGG